MKLPFIKTQPNKQHSESFLALLLREQQVKAIIFEEINQKISELSSHEEHLPTLLENASEETWLDTIDKTIGAAENKLPDNLDVQKTIFAVKQSWVEDNKIKREYLAKLKKICEELDLQPIGFIVFTEAIARFLHTRHGAPVTAILIEASDESVLITILRAGKIADTISTPLENSFSETIDKALHKSDSEVLPARIILFDTQHIEKLTRELTNHTWSDDLPFLHVPQVTALPKNTDAQAVLYGTAIQLGLQMEQVNMPQVKEEDLSEQIAPDEKDLTQPQVASDQSKQDDKKVPQEQTEEDSDDNFGFRKNTDIAEDKTAEDITNDENSPDETKEDNNKPIDFEKNLLKRAQENQEQLPINHQEEDTDKDQNLTDQFAHTKSNNFEMVQPSPKHKLPHPNLHLPKVQMPSLKGRKFLLLLPLLLLLLIITSVWYMLNVQATVTITRNPKTLEENQDVLFSTKQDNNFGQNIIHADTNTISEDGNATINTTGTKDVGTNAKGTITIYNNNDTSKALSAGTTITSSNNLKFTLDKSVTVASQSGDIFSGTKPGTTDVTVTASAIGTDYNLPSSTTFSTGISNVAAKNASAFSGGTKKTINTVATKDLEKALADIKTALDQKALNDAKNNSQSSPPIILGSTMTKKSFSKNPGDEASSVTVTETISYTTASITNSTLTDFAKNVLQGKIPSDQTLSDKNGITTQIQDAKAKSDHEVTATLKIQASLLPKLDTTQLAQSISGKSSTTAINTLKAQSQISDAIIKLTPNIPLIPQILPKFPNHIHIVTSD